MSTLSLVPDLEQAPEAARERPRDYALEAHRAAEEHLVACRAAFEVESYGDYYTEDNATLDLEDLEDPERDTETDPWPEDMAGPYCGCETCEVREVLHAAWPILWEAALEQARIEISEVSP